MIVEKREDGEVISRQLEFYRRCGHGPKICSTGITYHSITYYTYEFVPGVTPNDYGKILLFLGDHVWCKPPIPGEDTLKNYYGYILTLNDEYSINLSKQVKEILCRVSERWEKPVHLVHGDAMLENFVQTHDGIVPIDPGLPRGFCHMDNDIGKLLMNALTQWTSIRHGRAVQWSLNIDDASIGVLKVDESTLCSLLTHWIRVIKNGKRHPARVERYGRECVVPALSKVLVEGQNFSDVRYRWHTGRLRELRDHFLCRCAEFIGNS